MKTVKLRVLKATRAELFKNDTTLISGVVFIQRSLEDGNFCKFKCTSDENVNMVEIYHQLHNGMLYVQQVFPEVAQEACSTSIEVPLQLATLPDLSFAKSQFRRGRVYFKQRTNGTISNKVERIGGNTHYGDLARLYKEKRLYVQQSPLDHAITINNPAFAKAV